MERIEGQLADQEQLAKQALSWITCAKRPLITSELQHALGVEIGLSTLDEDNLPQIEDIVSICAGLVTVDEESKVIRLVHYTTQEYFQRTQKDWFPNAETEITAVCISYLSFKAFESGFCLTDEEFERRLWSNPLYDYASHNWGRHACQAVTLDKEVVKFLRFDAKVEASSQAMISFKRWPEHSNYSQKAPQKMTGLHLMAYFGVQWLAEILIRDVADVDVKNSHGRTPLSYATEGGHGAVVRLLLEKGADFRTKDKWDRTLLSYAAEGGHEAAVRLLLEKGASIEAKIKGGRTPLLYASCNGHEAVVRLLLEKGASIEAQTKGGQTPLWCAAERGHEAVVRLLLEKGAEIDAKDKGHQTPLLHAAWIGQEAVVRLLLENGADIETKLKGGRTPLLYAAWNGHEAIVRLLIEKGAKIEANAEGGRTPLSFAAGNGHVTVVRLLLEMGASVEAKGKRGRTPLSYAAENRHEAVFRLLESHAASLNAHSLTPTTIVYT